MFISYKEMLLEAHDAGNIMKNNDCLMFISSKNKNIKTIKDNVDIKSSYPEQMHIYIKYNGSFYSNINMSLSFAYKNMCEVSYFEKCGNIFKNGYIFDEIFDVNFVDSDGRFDQNDYDYYNEFVDSVRHKKKFHDLYIMYHPELNSPAWFSSYAFFNAKIDCTRDGSDIEIDKMVVNKHYYKPFVNFKHIIKIESERTNRDEVYFKFV